MQGEEVMKAGSYQQPTASQEGMAIVLLPTREHHRKYGKRYLLQLLSQANPLWHILSVFFLPQPDVTAEKCVIPSSTSNYDGMFPADGNLNDAQLEEDYLLLTQPLPSVLASVGESNDEAQHGEDEVRAITKEVTLVNPLRCGLSCTRIWPGSFKPQLYRKQGTPRCPAHINSCRTIFLSYVLLLHKRVLPNCPQSSHPLPARSKAPCGKT